jgi:hypothetical protein
LLGFLEAVEADGEIPLILKINAHDLLHEPDFYLEFRRFDRDSLTRGFSNTNQVRRLAACTICPTRLTVRDVTRNECALSSSGPEAIRPISYAQDVWSKRINAK